MILRAAPLMRAAHKGKDMTITTSFLYYVLILGAIAVLGQIALQMHWYKVRLWKSIPAVIVVILTGLFGSQLWFFVENLYFEGRSLYGAVFLCPVVFFPVSKLLKIRYGEMMDFIAPSGCLVLGLAKLQCMRDGCCGGKFLYMDENRINVHFPSQLVEFFVFIVIAVILIILSHNPRMRTKIYPYAMLSYGACRFVLDFFRDTTPNFLFGLTKGSFWSVCSFVLGLGALLFIHYKDRQYRKSSCAEKEI